MHAAVLQLAPIFGAEKSKVPFYIAGGALVVWAVFVSVGLGMRKPDFPVPRGAARGHRGHRRARAGGREHGGGHLWRKHEDRERPRDHHRGAHRHHRYSHAALTVS